MNKPKKVSNHGKVKWMVDLRGIGGGRQFFESQGEAERSQSQSLLEQQTFGKIAFDLPYETRIRFLKLDRAVMNFGATLEEVVAFWQKHHRPLEAKPIVEAAKECITAKTAAGRRKRTVQQLRYSLDSFLEHVGEVECSEVTAVHIETWLSKSGWALPTRKTRLTDVRTFLAFCLKRSWVPSNMALSLEPIQLEEKPPGILTPDQVGRLLVACQKVCPAMLPFFALAVFAGVRPSELLTLTWSDVDLVQGHLTVQGHRAKTRRRRLVAIQPNAVAWLNLGGDLPPRNWQRRWDTVRKAAGFAVRGKEKGDPWPQDCLRHSFCSYALPVHGAAWTALQAGHSETILFKHYRELVSKAAAETFWKISP